jgi:hypothetical protein
MSDEKPFDYHKWLQINQFLKKIHDMHIMEQQAMEREVNFKKGWLNRRNEMLLDIDMIDKVVDMMDSYPEAENIIYKLQRRNLNDKDF